MRQITIVLLFSAFIFISLMLIVSACNYAFLMDVYTFCLAVSRFYSYLFSRLHIAVFLLEVCLCLVPNTSPRLMGKTAKMEKMLQVDWPFWPSIKRVNSNEKPKVFFQVLNYQYINWVQDQITLTFFPLGKSSCQL